MITFAVFHCNRLFYLKNCIESIMDFVGLDDIDLLVVDNSSSEKGVYEYLSSLPDQVTVKQFHDRTPHELHRAMNYAIRYSKKKGNEYVNFIQEDYQYLYKHPFLTQWVHDAFASQPKVAQLQSNMAWKWKCRKLKFSPVEAGGVKWYILHKKPPCDNGFTRVALYDKIGMYPEKVSIHGREKGYTSGESWFKHKCKSFRRLMLAEPNMGMLMDCAYIRGNKRMGRYIPPVNKYYLKPLNQEERDQMKSIADEGRMCFIENFAKPDGWVPETTKKHSLRKESVPV